MLTVAAGAVDPVQRCELGLLGEEPVQHHAFVRSDRAVRRRQVLPQGHPLLGIRDSVGLVRHDQGAVEGSYLVMSNHHLESFDY